VKTLIWTVDMTSRSAGVFIYKEAKRLGYDVMVSGNRSNAKMFMQVFNQYKPNVVFSTAIHQSLLPAYKEIRAAGCKLVFWYPDMTERSRNNWWCTKFDHVADGLVFSIADTAQRYANLAKYVVWLPQYFDATTCAEPTEKLPVRLSPSKPIFDLVFIGTVDGLRASWLDILNKHYTCNFRGMTSKQPGVRGRAMAEAYAQAKISFGVQRSLFKTKARYVVSNRIYNAIGSGSFHISPQVTDLDLCYTQNVHCVMHNDTLADLRRLIDFYLEHAELREEIAREGQTHTLLHHSLQFRVVEYWSVLEAVCRNDPAYLASALSNLVYGYGRGIWSLDGVSKGA